MGNVLDTESRGPSSRGGRGHYAMCLGDCYSASFDPGVSEGRGWGGGGGYIRRWTRIPSGGRG